MASNFKQTVGGTDGNSPSSSQGEPAREPHLVGMNLYDLVDHLNILGVRTRMSVTETSVTLTIKGKRVRFSGGEAAADAAFKLVLSYIAEVEERLVGQLETTDLS